MAKVKWPRNLSAVRWTGQDEGSEMGRDSLAKRTNQGRILSVCALLAFASGASAEVIGCPSHAEQEPNWNRSSSGSGTVLARKAAEPATRMLETAHFSIFYQTEGVHAVAGSGTDKDGNGHPDNIDSIGAIAERVWRLGVDTLGYLPPLNLDTTMIFKGVVPSGKFPIEILDMVTVVPEWGGKRYMGYAIRPKVENGRRQGLVIENDFVDSEKGLAIQVKVDPVNTNGTDSLLIDYTKDPLQGWKVAISHEFYHNLQHRYDPVYLYGFHEMSAVWFATRCYPSVKHHWQYYPGYLRNLDISVFETDGNGPYENFPFVTALVAAYGEGILKDLWSVHQRLFKGDESVWFKDALDTLKKDQVQFSHIYMKSALELVGNQPGKFNENGALKVSNVKVQEFPLFRGTGFQGPQTYGIGLVKLNRFQLDSGWNLAFRATTTNSVGGLLRLPSGKVGTCRSATEDVVVSKEVSDTGWIAASISVPNGQYDGSVIVASTQDPVNIRRRIMPALNDAPKFRVDLQGRPVQPGARGIVLEGSPATGWTRTVKMGE